MTAHDLYLLAPPIALAGVGGLVVLLDLVTRRTGLVAAVSLLGLLLPAAFALALWGDVNTGGAMAGVFDTLVVDKFALFFQFLVLAVVALVILGAADYVARFQRYKGEFYALVLFSALGMMLLAAATELVSMYISLELTSLPLAALAAFLRDERSTEAGLKFLLLSAMSSALLLYGMVLVYGYTGSTQLGEIAQAVAAGGQPFGSPAVLAGGVLIAAGFGFKIAMFPFQMWTPDVYEGAPTPVTAYLSVASKAAGFAVLLRLFSTAFGAVSLDWGMLFAVLSALSMTVGNLMAMGQSNIKRLLAYSTIAHAGYILVGVAAMAVREPAGSEGLGLSSVLFYLGAYAATNLAAFFAVIAITNRTGNDQVDGFAGMGKKAPVVSAVLAFSLVSLIGIPPTAGFMGKLYLFNAAVRADLVWLALVGVVNSAVSAYYYLRVVKALYVSSSESRATVPSSPAVRLALGVSGLGVLFLGIFPAPLLGLAEAAVATLLSLR
ncbi:MAG: NADH-quinone oxidoreductase subunit N [Chloroflexi bacterium]|nr:NADH-quinone oxidoreductase subunit N [Chloroflexota bacterium]